MKTNHILRKSLVVIVLALGTMMFAMYPSRPTRHAESENTPSEASDQMPVNHEEEPIRCQSITKKKALQRVKPSVIH